jgi:hypothetical protein
MIFEVEKTYKTPHLFIDYQSGVIKMSGRCISEYPSEYFKEFINNINEYSKLPKKNTTFDISLEYANTSSIKCILDILKIVENINNTSLTINWFYEREDEDILDLGKDFECLISTKMNFKEI